jgi:hypothetical protein
MTEAEHARKGSGRRSPDARAVASVPRAIKSHMCHSPLPMFRKQVSGPVESLDPPSWPRRRSRSSEFEERPAHGPNPSFCALHAEIPIRCLTRQFRNSD